VVNDGNALFEGWCYFVGLAFEFNGVIWSDFSSCSQGETEIKEGCGRRGAYG